MSDVIDISDFFIGKEKDLVYQCGECASITFVNHLDGWVECAECGAFASNIIVGEEIEYDA